MILPVPSSEGANGFINIQKQKGSIKMKKGSFIAYLGAVTTMGIVLAKAGKMTKKYGQPMFPKKKISLEKIGNVVNKVLDKVGAK